MHLEWNNPVQPDQADANLVRKKLYRKTPGGPGAEYESAVVSFSKESQLRSRPD